MRRVLSYDNLGDAHAPPGCSARAELGTREPLDAIV